MIEINSLSKHYGPHHAITDLSFKVERGEVVGFLGPNGAGKTTTMKIITGYMAPSSGTVSVAGFDVFEDPVQVKKRIGYLPETPPVYGDMIVEDYLKFVAKLKGVERNRVKDRVQSALQGTQLKDVKHRMIQNLSKGFRQRVGIAQAIVSDPEILILDEPTVGLDPKQVAEIRSLIQELAGQHTIVLSTHILPEVQAVCEKVIIINEGKIVAEDSLQGLSQRMTAGKRVNVRVMRKVDELTQGLPEQDYVLHVEKQDDASFQIDLADEVDATEKVAAFIVEQGAGLVELQSQNVSLEDIFLQLTSNESGGAE